MEIYNTIGWILIGISSGCMLLGKSGDLRLTIPFLWGIFLVWRF